MAKDHKFVNAVILATQAHSNQFRKFSKLPAIIHPLRVSELVLKYCSNHLKLEIIRTAAVLHDTIEDTWITEDFLKEKFGNEIATLVSEVTEDKKLPREERHRKYKEKLCDVSDYAKFLKLCDISDNMDDALPRQAFKKYLKESSDILAVLNVNKQSDIYPEFIKIKSVVLKKFKDVNQR